MNTWQKIDTAPKDGTWVLLAGGKDGGWGPTGPCVVGFWYEGDWCYCYWDDGWRSAYTDPTHWMPCPEAP